jgi:hypothetical protein
MYQWLAEHSFDVVLVAGYLGLVLIVGIAMLDFADAIQWNGERRRVDAPEGTHLHSHTFRTKARLGTRP